MRISDWSSDVCSSDLVVAFDQPHGAVDDLRAPAPQAVGGGAEEVGQPRSRDVQLGAHLRGGVAQAGVLGSWVVAQVPAGLRHVSRVALAAGGQVAPWVPRARRARVDRQGAGSVTR